MITTKDLFKSETDCCGCEACIQVCPKGIIKPNAHSDGFIYPNAINPSACIDCNRCLDVCPLKKKYLGSKALCHYGGHNKKEQEIKNSASGGLAASLARNFIKNGGIVYGVSYSDDFKIAIYKRCQTLDSIESLRGSKYTQAFKSQIYSQVRQDLLSKKKVLFFGLPCEVQALKYFLVHNYDNLFSVSLICHGPTSPLVLREYIDTLRIKSKTPLKTFTLRAKPKGWKPYFIKATFTNGEIFEEEFHPSTFGIAFKELKRPSCSKCKFKLKYNHSYINADLIIGDFHGATPNSSTYNKWGVSQSSVLTQKGEELMKITKEDFLYSEISPRDAIHYNRALHKIIKPRLNRNQYATALSKYGLVYASKLKSIRIIDVMHKVSQNILRYLAMYKRYLTKR